MGEVIRIPNRVGSVMDPVETYRHLINVHGVGRRHLLRESDRSPWFALRLIIDREHFIRHLYGADHDHREGR